jgi:hypothetical protein
MGTHFNVTLIEADHKFIRARKKEISSNPPNLEFFHLLMQWFSDLNLKVGFSSLVNLVLKDAQACEEQPVSFSVFC